MTLLCLVVLIFIAICWNKTESERNRRKAAIQKLKILFDSQEHTTESQIITTACSVLRALKARVDSMTIAESMSRKKADNAMIELLKLKVKYEELSQRFGNALESRNQVLENLQTLPESMRNAENVSQCIDLLNQRL